jgi:hypothetical protein
MQDLNDNDAFDGGNKPDKPTTVVPITKTPTKLVDPFDLYLQHEEGSGAFFDGDFINFNGQTGAWTRGPDKEPIGATVMFLCNMHEVWLGWIKLVDGKIVDRRIGRLVDGYQRPPREELDDFEEHSWPRNRRSGEPEDPWHQTTYLPMRCMEDDAPCVYGPFAATALRAIRDFVATYRRVDRGGKFPVVLLESRSFQNQGGGTTYVPVLKIVGWEYWDGTPAPEVEPVPIKPPSAAKPAALPPRKAPGRGDMDDEIPF